MNLLAQRVRYGLSCIRVYGEAQMKKFAQISAWLAGRCMP
jgi:hypothetical protein